MLPPVATGAPLAELLADMGAVATLIVIVVVVVAVVVVVVVVVVAESSTLPRLKQITSCSLRGHGLSIRTRRN